MIRHGELKKSLASILVAAGALLFPAFASWSSTNRDIVEANALYGAGKFEEALKVYDRLAEERPESPELQFNRGAALYNMGDFGKARDAFEQAGILSKDPSIQALSAYNSGNCALQEGQSKAAENPEEALSTLGRSLGYYKDALSRDNSLEAAAHNLEMAKRSIQELRQQMAQQEQQKQQQQQQKDQKKEEMKEKLDELIKDQEQQNQQSEQAAEQQRQQQQDPSQTAPSPEQMKEMADQQGQTRDKTEDLADKMSEGQTEDPADAEKNAKANAEKAAEKQKEAEDLLKNQQAEEANKAQDEALDKLKEAREALDSEDTPKDQQQNGDQKQQDDNKADDQKQQDQTSQDSQKPSGDQQSSEQPQTADKSDDVPPPDADAKDILNQEKQNKEQRNLQRMIRVRPVEKDW